MNTASTIKMVKQFYHNNFNPFLWIIMGYVPLNKNRIMPKLEFASEVVKKIGQFIATVSE